MSPIGTRSRLLLNQSTQPGQGRKLDILKALPRTLLTDHLGFEQSNDGLGQRIVREGPAVSDSFSVVDK